MFSYVLSALWLPWEVEEDHFLLSPTWLAVGSCRLCCLSRVPSRVFTFFGKLLVSLEHLEEPLSPYDRSFQQSSIVRELGTCHHGED